MGQCPLDMYWKCTIVHICKVQWTRPWTRPLYVVLHRVANTIITQYLLRIVRSHCTTYSVYLNYCTAYNAVHYTTSTVQTTMYVVQCTDYSEQSAMYIVRYVHISSYMHNVYLQYRILYTV